MKRTLKFANFAVASLGLSIPSCARSDVAADDARAQPAKSPCPTTGSPMVKLTTPSGWSFCIDKTAVKQKDYEVWVVKSGAREPVPVKLGGEGLCGQWTALPVAQLTDDGPQSACKSNHYTPEKTPDAPVVCVGACQARAYCLSIGKRLCARAGGGALPVPKSGVIESPEAADEPDPSELYYACSQGGKTRFAWGDSKPAPSEQCAVDGCRAGAAPFDEIVGMSDGPGSPEERCFPDGTDHPAICLTRSGHGYGIDPERRDGACDVAGSLEAGLSTGIRCCADAL